MSSIVKASGGNANRLRKVFQELLNTLPPGVAVLGSKWTKNDDGTIVWLKPARKHAAEFCAHIDDAHNNLIDVSFGAGTTFELPSESRIPDDAGFDMLLEAVRAMGLATIAGSCREYFGFMGIRGTIEVSENNVVRCSNFFHPRLLPKLLRYTPYI
jgi:hypothetical protein